MKKILIKKEYLQEALNIKNLYNGTNIMGDYTTFKLIQKSLMQSLEYNELKVVSISKTMKLIDEIKEHCKTDLEQMCNAVRNSEISSFSFSNHKTVSIFPDLSTIINEDLPTTLDEISEDIESLLGSLLKDIITARIYIDKFNKLEDEEYIEDNDEISTYMIKTHNDVLDYDRLEELSENKTEYDGDKLIQDIIGMYCTMDVAENMGYCLSYNISSEHWMLLCLITDFFEIYTDQNQTEKEI